MDRLPGAPVSVGFPAVLGLWEGGTGARGVEVYLGDLPDDKPVWRVWIGTENTREVT